MLEDVGLVRTGFELLGGVCVSAIGWFVKGHADRIHKIEDVTEATRNALAAHKIDDANYKLEAEQRFAKDSTMQASLSRIHDRIDDVGSDIKEILHQLGGAVNGHKS